MTLLIAAALLFLIGCNGLTSDKVKPFIAGTYISSWKTAFSIAVDTMNISAISAGGSEGYIIVRRTHLQFINAVKKREPEYSISKWQGSYNPGDKTIVVQNNGRVISFDPDNKVLRMGNIVYRKL